MAAEPTHPDYPAAIGLTPVSIAGAGSTASADPFDLRAAMAVRATLARAESPPAPSKDGEPSLVELYKRWVMTRYLADAEAAKASKLDDEVERKAFKSGRKRHKKALATGLPRTHARSVAFLRYRRKGGQASRQAFLGRLDGGT